MSAPSSLHVTKSDCVWHDLYEAALFETDRDQVAARIEQAERAITARIRELLMAKDDHIDEDQFLDDARYALQALRNCVGREANAA